MERDIYKELYERNVLWKWSQDYSVDKDKKRREKDTMDNREKIQSATPKTKTPTIPNVKNLIRNRNIPEAPKAPDFELEKPKTRTNYPTPTQPKQPTQGIRDRIRQQNIRTQQPTPTPTSQTPPRIQQTTWTVQWSQPDYSWYEMWQQAAQAQLEAWAKQQDQILKNYNDTIAGIRLQDDQVRSQFKNADSVMNKIESVNKAYQQWIMNPEEISQTTGLQRNEVEQILQGNAFKMLEFQDRATENDRKDFQYQIDKLQTDFDRWVDNYDRNLDRLEYDHENTLEDIKRQAGLSAAQMKKMWALTWAINSSWYMTALDNISTDTKRSIKRLKEVRGFNEDEILNARENLVEDFQTNMTKIKDYFDRGMDWLRWSGLANIQQIQQKYWVATNEATKALEQLQLNLEQQKASLLQETMQMQTSFNERWRQEIDYLDKYVSEASIRDEYLNVYKIDPNLANQMYPELANTLDRQAAISEYWSTPAVRNFNPGNIMDLWFGGRDVEWERFTVFDTPQEWFQALVDKIRYNQSGQSSVYHPDMSLIDYFKKYAPASDNNDPIWYAQSVASALWVPADWIWIGGLDPEKFAAEIAKHEDRNSYRMLTDLWIIGGSGEHTGNTSEQQEREAILSAVRTGNLTNTLKDDYRKKALDEWWIDEYVQAEWKKYDGEAIIKMKQDLTKWASYNDMLDISRWYETIQGIYSQWVDNATWFEDISAINSLQRMIDPGATVREGDVELIQKAVPVFNRIDPNYKREQFTEGSVLPPKIREKLIRTADNIYKSQANAFNDTIKKQRWSNFDRAGSSLETEWLLFDIQEPTTNINQAQQIQAQTDPVGTQWWSLPWLDWTYVPFS